MARLRRRWRVAKWEGVVLLLIIVVAWVESLDQAWVFLGASGSRSITQDQRHVWHILRPAWTLTLRQGGLSYSHFGQMQIDHEAGLFVTGGPSSPRWSPLPGSDLPFAGGNSDFLFFVPFWFPFLLVAGPTAYLFYRDRRSAPHRCPSCGYDLTGKTSGVCPECGRRLREESSTKDDTDGHG